MSREGATENPYLYIGGLGVYHEGGDLYHMKARYYSSELLRFVSADPLGIPGLVARDSRLNLYAYCAGNPVMFVDPEGLFWSELDVYGAMSDTAAAGYQRGGIMGNAQGIFYNSMTALLDVIGGQGVGGTAARSGAAAGEGRPGAAITWGAASVGLIMLNAYTAGQSASALGKIGTYAQNPLLYEIGSKTLPTAIYDDLGLAGMNQIEKGVVIVEKLYHGSKLAAFLRPVPTTAYGKTIWTGLTPGGAYVLGCLTAGVNTYIGESLK